MASLIQQDGHHMHNPEGCGSTQLLFSALSLYFADKGYSYWAGADLGFIKGGATSRSNLLGSGVQSMLELGGLGACPPRKILKNSC